MAEATKEFWRWTEQNWRDESIDPKAGTTISAGVDVGSVSSTGYFTAQTIPGSGTVTATNDTITGTATVDIIVGPVDHIIVNPISETIIVGEVI